MGRGSGSELDFNLDNRRAFELDDQKRLSQETELAKIFQSGYEGLEEDGDQDDINLLDQKRMSDLTGQGKEKMKKMLKLEDKILKRGLLKFNKYEDKLKFMDTALFLFGMKLHRMSENINFYDADFANTLQIRCALFDNKTLE